VDLIRNGRAVGEIAIREGMTKGFYEIKDDIMSKAKKHKIFVETLKDREKWGNSHKRQK